MPRNSEHGLVPAPPGLYAGPDAPPPAPSLHAFGVLRVDVTRAADGTVIVRAGQASYLRVLASLASPLAFVGAVTALITGSVLAQGAPLAAAAVPACLGGFLVMAALAEAWRRWRPGSAGGPLELVAGAGVFVLDGPAGARELAVTAIYERRVLSGGVRRIEVWAVGAEAVPSEECLAVLVRPHAPSGAPKFARALARACAVPLHRRSVGRAGPSYDT